MRTNLNAVVEFSTLYRIQRIKSQITLDGQDRWFQQGATCPSEEKKKKKKKNAGSCVSEAAARGRVMAAFSRYLTARNSSIAGGLIFVLYLVKYSRRTHKRNR